MKSRIQRIGKEKPFLQWSIVNLLGILIIIWIVYDCTGISFNSFLKNRKLEENSIKVKAIVINTKNYFGHNPVTRSFSYSYEFGIDNKKYRGDTNNSKYAVGDSIEIEYSASNPEYNRPLESSK